MKAEKRELLGKRIQALVNKAPTGQEEGNNSEGGFTVSKEILPEILSPNFSEGSLYADCTIYNVGAGKNGIKIPVTDVTTIDKTTVRGGFRAYVVDEGVAKTASAGKFSNIDLALNKMAVVIPCTDELLQDSSAIAQYMSDSAGEALMALADDSIVNGNGLMTGIASCACTGMVSMSDPMTLAELHDMFDMYYGGKNGKWYVSKVRFGQIIDLFATPIGGGVGGSSILLTVTDGVYYLFGYPIVVVDTMVDNQILLADLTQYVIAQKEMTTAVNESLLWLEDEKYFRYVIRINGSALWKRPITLADGQVVYPFVMPSGFEESSSSSSGSESSSSSSIELFSSSSDSTQSSDSSASTPSSDSSSLSTESSKSNSSMSLSTQSSNSSDSSSLSTESSESHSSISDHSESSNP